MNDDTKTLTKAALDGIRFNAENDDSYLSLKERVDRLQYMSEQSDSAGIVYMLARAERNVTEHPSSAILALLEHVGAQAERLRKLEAALQAIAKIAATEYDENYFNLEDTVGRIGDIANAALDRMPFDDIVAGVDEDTAHGG